ncbi:uncharacterized protein PFL1_02098 [Pseudozyma flocculosa PF-1]|uniref:Uncharacterized protein n=1 Tax=Pseudozyma flocculosa TaxID=84751 RepID=A0A5C3F1R3_9BASI|nr:uncharacterized protein PFL1_02098 [Pseudozyma flocculosa PF-1]EPQ30574.1 hypothetical protein PFL1_02098 [Pseudozyma flocculosa PF-1]SPO37667.1 uncharacterized protein PSFLO_03143 [Pseudozyma flocculosa]
MAASPSSSNLYVLDQPQVLTSYSIVPTATAGNAGVQNGSATPTVVAYSPVVASSYAMPVVTPDFASSPSPSATVTTADVNAYSNSHLSSQSDQTSYLRGDTTTSGASLIWTSTLLGSRDFDQMIKPDPGAWQLEFLPPNFPFRPLDRFYNTTAENTLLEFIFFGHRVSVLDLKGPNRGKYKIYLDGNVTVVDAYSAESQPDAYTQGRVNSTLPPPIWTSGNLTSDLHSLGIETVHDDRQPAPQLHFYGALINPDNYNDTQSFSTVDPNTGNTGGNGAHSAGRWRKVLIVALPVLLCVCLIGGWLWWRRRAQRRRRRQGRTTQFSYAHSNRSMDSYTSYSAPQIVGGAPHMAGGPEMVSYTRDIVSFAREHHAQSQRAASLRREGGGGGGGGSGDLSPTTSTLSSDERNSDMPYGTYTTATSAAPLLSRSASQRSATAAALPRRSPSLRSLGHQPSASASLRHRHTHSSLKGRLGSSSTPHYRPHHDGASSPLLYSRDGSAHGDEDPFADPSDAATMFGSTATATTAQLPPPPPTITIRAPMPRPPGQVRTRTTEPTMSELVQSAVASEQQALLHASNQAVPSRVVVQEQDAGSIHIDSDDEWDADPGTVLPPPYEPRGMGRDY